MPQSRLHELPFMDLYVCLEGGGAPHYRKLVGNKATDSDDDVPDDYREDIERLASFLRDKFEADEMGFTYDGIRMRAAKVLTAGGLVWAALRRVADEPLPISQLGFMPQLVPYLEKLGRRDGLIFICGATGQGKTTTSSSLISDYLERYGGVAFTIEDPVEYNLEGRRGKNGFCYQVEVRNEDEWAEMLKRALRWHPNYILVGEIRTPDAANQLLRAATSGHLVITTMHAGSVEEGLEGLLQLAEQAIGDRAALLLAAGLTAIIHQSLTPKGLNASFFITEPNNPGAAIRSVIREKRIGQCRTFCDQQMALLRQSGKIFRD